MGQINEYVEEDHPVIVGVVTGRPREVVEAWENAAAAEYQKLQAWVDIQGRISDWLAGLGVDASTIGNADDTLGLRIELTWEEAEKLAGLLPTGSGGKL